MVILETIKVDDMCGGEINMAVIDKEGYHEIAREEINDIKNGLDSKQQWLYNYLEKL